MTSIIPWPLDAARKEEIRATLRRLNETFPPRDEARSGYARGGYIVPDVEVTP